MTSLEQQDRERALLALVLAVSIHLIIALVIPSEFDTSVPEFQQPIYVQLDPLPLRELQPEDLRRREIETETVDVEENPTPEPLPEPETPPERLSETTEELATTATGATSPETVAQPPAGVSQPRRTETSALTRIRPTESPAAVVSQSRPVVSSAVSQPQTVEPSGGDLPVTQSNAMETGDVPTATALVDEPRDSPMEPDPLAAFDRSIFQTETPVSSRPVEESFNTSDALESLNTASASTSRQIDEIRSFQQRYDTVLEEYQERLAESSLATNERSRLDEVTDELTRRIATLEETLERNRENLVTLDTTTSDEQSASRTSESGISIEGASGGTRYRIDREELVLGNLSLPPYFPPMLVAEFQFYVDAGGYVFNPEPLQSTGSPELDDRIREWIALWKFEPAQGSRTGVVGGTVPVIIRTQVAR